MVPLLVPCLLASRKGLTPLPCGPRLPAEHDHPLLPHSLTAVYAQATGRQLGSSVVTSPLQQMSTNVTPDELCLHAQTYVGAHGLRSAESTALAHTSHTHRSLSLSLSLTHTHTHTHGTGVFLSVWKMHRNTYAEADRRRGIIATGAVQSSAESYHCHHAQAFSYDGMP
jgi:hypothetical protein